MASNLIKPLTLAWHTIRAKTLMVSLAVILLGQGLAWYDLKQVHNQALDYSLALVILACCLLLQISVNLANDYFDGLAGIDGPKRLGPERTIQASLIKPNTMKYAVILSAFLASIFGLYLIIKGGWIFLLLGLLSLFGIYAYSGGKKPLASLGLGELAVFVYFGYLAVMASYALQSGYFNSHLFFPATQIGLLVSAIMLVNNIRDIDTDKAANKYTLAVRIGRPYAKKLYWFFMVTPFLLIPLDHYLPYYNFLLLPIALYLAAKIQHIKKDEGALFNRLLGQTSALVLAWSLLYLCSLLVK